MQRLRWKRKLHPPLREPMHQPQIDALLLIHVNVERRVQHDVDDLEVQGGVISIHAQIFTPSTAGKPWVLRRLDRT